MGLRVLLDTHVVLWAFSNPHRLSQAAHTLLENPNTALLVSAVSAWEIATKYRLGKLPGAERIVKGYLAHLTTLGTRELPVSSEHALSAGLFAVEHRDPFDRMLAAQAIAEGVPLVTSDPAMALFPGLATYW
ncbi:MAG: type II toxin-antitoxin system VapC family toxin [Chloroflexota bacterium]